MQMQKKYLAFYFEGREDELDLDELDLDALIERIVESGDDPREAVAKAVDKIVTPLTIAREKKEFIEEFQELFDEDPSCNKEDAYTHYLKGRSDAAVDDLMVDVLEGMDPREVDESDEEIEGDEDGEDEEEE